MEESVRSCVEAVKALFLFVPSETKGDKSTISLLVASRLPARQKSPLGQELHPPHILSEPLPLFVIIATAYMSKKQNGYMNRIYFL
ncbi:hypothetical protein COE15_22150 [Bacillus cereus]|nr:hypothetical protein COE15_22150 [Bacillus cereus]